MSSFVLYHFAFDPGSRAVRLALGEARPGLRQVRGLLVEDAIGIEQAGDFIEAAEVGALNLMGHGMHSV